MGSGFGCHYLIIFFSCEPQTFEHIFCSGDIFNKRICLKVCHRFGARYLIVGWAATPFVAKGGNGEANPNMLPTNLIMMKGLRVLGCPTVISTQKDPSIRPERLKQLFTWCAEERINPYVSHTFPFHDFKKAMRAKWNGEVIGGCVLDLSM